MQRFPKSHEFATTQTFIVREHVIWIVALRRVEDCAAMRRDQGALQDQDSKMSRVECCGEMADMRRA